MIRGLFPSVLRQLGRSRGQGPADAASDGDLLRAYALRRDEAAFATLLDRHGSMVFGVCRRLLWDAQDAEDAFQATFLVLARKAGVIEATGSVAPWLHSVACRVALKARTETLRRRQYVREVAEMPDVPEGEPALSEPLRRELQGVLDEELQRLPAKYRAPLVLCYLEGKSNVEAARELGWTKGTVSGRLARARDLLRGRLRRRGFALGAAALPALLDPGRLRAAPPPTLAAATLRGAAALPATAGLSPRVQALAEPLLRPRPHARLLAVVTWLCLGSAALGALLWVRASQMPPTPATPGDKTSEGDPTRAPGRWRWQSSFRADGSQVNALAFTPDGRALMTAGADGTVKLWDVPAGKLRATLQRHEAPALALARSADGRTLTSAAADGSVLVGDLTGKRRRKTLQLGPTLLGVAALSPDGKTLAATISRLAGPPRQTDEVWLWDLETGKLRGKLGGHHWQTMRLAFAPGGKALATTGLRPRTPADGPPDERGDFLIMETKLWDLPGGKVFSPPRGGFALAFSPDGKTLATSSFDWSVHRHGIDLWDVKGFGKRRSLNLGSEAGALCFSPDGQTLAAASATLMLWKVRSGKLLARLTGHQEPVVQALFSRDGRRLAVVEATGAIHVWASDHPR
jgi:RNA polymerase sigma factor (sigma-70 family)